MPRLSRRLTKTVADSLEAVEGEVQSFFWDPELVGFGLKVTRSGQKSFVVKRKNLRVVIDRANVISVEEARQRAIELLASIGRGGNPVAERRTALLESETAKRANATVWQVWESYRIAKKQLRPKTVVEYEYCLKKYCQGWLALPLGSLAPEFIAAEHTRIRDSVARKSASRLANGNSTANAVMRLVRALWNYAEENGLLASTQKNPVRTLSRNRAWYSEPPRERFVPQSQLPLFYAAIHGFRARYLQDEWVYRDLVRLMLFTGLRLGEASRLRWQSVDFEAGLIRLSAEDTKARRRFNLPMSDYVAALLRSRPRHSDWVFTGMDGHITEPRGILRYASKYIAAHLGDPTSDSYYYNPHSLRRTFVTVAESCDLSVYTLKGLINHSVGRDVTAIYVGRDEERLRTGAQKVADRLKLLCRPTLSLVRAAASA